jgi:hypothetical protein
MTRAEAAALAKKLEPPKPNVFDKPSMALLAKLGSIIVHVEEANSVGGHFFDWIAITSLLNDGEVKDFVSALRKQGFVPRKRTERNTR